MDKPQHKTIVLRHSPPPESPTETPSVLPSTDLPQVSQCQHCASTKSPLWRRGERGEVLCNACGLYWKHHGRYRPTEPQTGTRSTRSSSSLKSSPKRTALMPIDPNLVIQNGPQPNNNSRKKMYTDLPKRPRLRPALAPKPLNSITPCIDSQQDSIRFIMHGHRMLFPGDHVVVKGPNKLAYFAILLDFTLDPDSKRKQCLLKWLLPKPEYSEIIFTDSTRIEPQMFTIGDEHQQWEPLESILDVFYSPHQHGVVSTRSPVLEDLEAAHWLLSMS